MSGHGVMPENMEVLKKSVGMHREAIGANLKELWMARSITNGITNDPSKSRRTQSIWNTAQITKYLFVHTDLMNG